MWLSLTQYIYDTSGTIVVLRTHTMPLYRKEAPILIARLGPSLSTHVYPMRRDYSHTVTKNDILPISLYLHPDLLRLRGRVSTVVLCPVSTKL
jgi:hypothetical protein